MDKDLRAAVKAMAAHQLAMADALETLLLKAKENNAASELTGHSEEFEGLMENLSYE